MTGIIIQYGGTIDEFLGDAILSIFGAPMVRDDDDERAVACAVAMQLAMQQVNAENIRMGLPEVAMGIDLNTGMLVVGNIGSEKRAKYGIVGRHVNLTARVESYTDGGQIYISEHTYQDVEAELRIDGQMVVEPKGVQEPLTIYAVGGIGAPFELYLPQQQETLRPLERALDVQFKVLDEKEGSGKECTATLIELSSHRTLLRTEESMQPLDNLKIVLEDGSGAVIAQEIYAKVVPTQAPISGTYLLQFTSIPQEAEDFFKSVLQELTK